MRTVVAFLLFAKQSEVSPFYSVKLTKLSRRQLVYHLALINSKNCFGFSQETEICQFEWNDIRINLGVWHEGIKKLMGKMRLITRGKDERRWLSLITKKALRQMPKSVPISIAHRIFDCHLMKHLSRYLFHFKRIPPMIINYLFNWVIFV